MQIKTLSAQAVNLRAIASMLCFEVFFHHVGDVNDLSPLETWAGSLAAWILVWPGLRENSTLMQVQSG